MPDLSFHIGSAAPVPFAAVPLLSFGLEIGNAAARERVHSIALRCQIQIESPRRRYEPSEQARLGDLFGEPDRWSATLRPMLWTHVQATVPSFVGSTIAELDVPCTFDFNVGATKYFHALESGDLPLLFLFSGTVFYEGADGRALQVAPIPWDREARFRLAARTWRELMDHYYPDSAWLRLRRDTFELLSEYKQRAGIPTWDEAIERLLPAVERVRS